MKLTKNNWNKPGLAWGGLNCNTARAGNNPLRRPLQLGSRTWPKYIYGYIFRIIFPEISFRVCVCVWESITHTHIRESGCVPERILTCDNLCLVRTASYLHETRQNEWTSNHYKNCHGSIWGCGIGLGRPSPVRKSKQKKPPNALNSSSSITHYLFAKMLPSLLACLLVNNIEYTFPNWCCCCCCFWCAPCEAMCKHGYGLSAMAPIWICVAVGCVHIYLHL